MVFLFGKSSKKNKKRFIQEANRRTRLKGTQGTFGKYCKKQGLAPNGKVTLACINRAKRSGNTTLIRRAVFAQNIKGYEGAKKKRSRFGKPSTKPSTRKSPKQSATKFPVKTVRTGLDGNKWVVIQTVKGIKRWKRVRSTKFGKRGSTKFGKRGSRFGKRGSRFGNEIDNIEKINHKLDKLEEKLEISPDESSKIARLKRRAIRLIETIKKQVTYENVTQATFNIISFSRTLSDLITTVHSLEKTYQGAYNESGLMRTFLAPVEMIFRLIRSKTPDNAPEAGGKTSLSTMNTSLNRPFNLPNPLNNPFKRRYTGI